MPLFFYKKYNSKYYNTKEFKTLKKLTDNTCSLPKNIDDPEHRIQSTKTDFDIIAASESRLIKDKLLSIDGNLPNYSY